VGSPRLAELAEAELKGDPVSDGSILAEIAPCFVEADGRRTDTIVLACTHYPLLLERLKRLAQWPVSFIDPASAIARRVAGLLPPAAAADSTPPPRITFTSGRAPSPVLAAALPRFGIAGAEPARV
jgi:glutamate racemase